MRKAALVLAGLLISAISIPVTAPAQAAVLCNYNPAQHTLRVSIEASVTSVEMFVTPSGNINVAGEDCAESNAVFNVDKIFVEDNAGAAVQVHVDVKNPFAPGFTNEPGDNEEIEFKFDLRGGKDRVTVDGELGPAVDLRAGRTKIGGIRRDVINFNGDGDHDMVLLGVDEILLQGSNHNDILTGRGGQGTGEEYAKRMSVVGLGGDDFITGGISRDKLHADGEACSPCPGRDVVRGLGGADKIYGDGGRDRLDGDIGSDELFGGPANDKVEGGEGNDSLYGEDGNDKLIGGKDFDACFGGAGADEMKNCENNPPNLPSP